MNRQPEYRAWDIENKQMIYQKDDELCAFFSDQSIVSGWGCDTVNTDIILMQYTNVKDKKDVKIFEDDICRAFKPNSGLGSQNDLYKIIYSIEFAQYVFYCIKSDNSYRINRIITKRNDQPFLITNRDVEVIGNIHSNPELL